MINKNKNRIQWITRTAIMLALLITLQAVTAPFGVSLLTGSLVNMMLVVSVLVCGLSAGLTVAVISPIVAKLLGIGPLWSIIPFIVVGNCVLVLLWYFLVNHLLKGKQWGYFVALVVGAVAKFLVLYFSIVRLMIPLFLNLPEKQASVLSATFSVSQLFTALIGGTLASILLPIIKKATTAQSG